MVRACECVCVCKKRERDFSTDLTDSKPGMSPQKKLTIIVSDGQILRNSLKRDLEAVGHCLVVLYWCQQKLNHILQALTACDVQRCVAAVVWCIQGCPSNDQSPGHQKLPCSNGQVEWSLV